MISAPTESVAPESEMGYRLRQLIAASKTCQGSQRNMGDMSRSYYDYRETALRKVGVKMERWSQGEQLWWLEVPVLVVISLLL